VSLSTRRSWETSSALVGERRDRRPRAWSARAVSDRHGPPTRR
jgi:hypothetical protein